MGFGRCSGRRWSTSRSATSRTAPTRDVDGLYGRGFTLYGLLEDEPIERRLALDRARQGAFDLIVFGDIWRYFGSFVELLPWLGRSRVAFLDGADYPAPYPYGSAFWRVPAVVDACRGPTLGAPTSSASSRRQPRSAGT